MISYHCSPRFTSSPSSLVKLSITQIFLNIRSGAIAPHTELMLPTGVHSLKVFRVLNSLYKAK